MVAKNSPTNEWKTVYTEDINAFDGSKIEAFPTSSPKSVMTSETNISNTLTAEGFSPLLIFGISGLFALFILFFIAIALIIKKRNSRNANLLNENVELCCRKPHPTMKFHALRSKHVSCRNSPPSKKKKTDSSGIAGIMGALHFLIQEPDSTYHDIPLNDRDAWLNNPLSLGERIDLDEGSEISFFDSNNKLIRGKLIFKGTEDELKTYQDQIPKTNPITETIMARLVEIEESIKTLTAALGETRTGFAKLDNRLKALEKKKKPIQPAKTNTLWQTMINGVPQLIASLPDITQQLMTKITAFRGRSSEITTESRGDLRPLLYKNQGFFITHYYDANACAGAVYYLLFGPEVAKKAFLPTPFYSQGPRQTDGQRKPCLNFKATSAFFLALDLVISNVFTPDHRLTFLTKGRTYINRNVNTIKKHGRNKTRSWNVERFDDGGFGFLEEEALTQDYAYERDNVATNPAQVYNWAIQLGLDYERQQAPPNDDEEYDDGGNNSDDDNFSV